MKKTGKWFASIVSKALIVILVILLLPFAGQLFQLILPGITGEISTQSRIARSFFIICFPFLIDIFLTH